MSFLVLAAASLAACNSGSSGGGNPPPGPVVPPPPVQVELATLARAGMADAEEALPRDLNGLEVLGNDNPSEFDDWFQ
jgi:hypothetical protein